MQVKCPPSSPPPAFCQAWLTSTAVAKRERCPPPPPPPQQKQKQQQPTHTHNHKRHRLQCITSTASASAVALDASEADIAAAIFSSVSRDWLQLAVPSPPAEEVETTEPPAAPPANIHTKRGTATCKGAFKVVVVDLHRALIPRVSTRGNTYRSKRRVKPGEGRRKEGRRERKHLEYRRPKAKLHQPATP